MADSAREVAAAIADLIHAKRPQAAFLTYIEDHTDGIMSESNTAVGRPLPLWPYSASDNVRRALGSEPGKVAINLSMAFVDFPWRYAHVPRPRCSCACTRTWRTAGRRRSPSSARWIRRIARRWRRPSRCSSGTRRTRISTSASETPRGCCCSRRATRGLSRLLPAAQRAAHPVRVATNCAAIDADPGRFDLVIVPGAMPGGLDATSATAGGCWSRARRRRRAADRPRRRHGGRRATGGFTTTRGCRPRRHQPAVHRRRLRRARAGRPPLLTLIPTAMFGPPEKVWSDKVETTRARAWSSRRTARAAPPTSRGTSAGSTTGTARRRTPALMADVIDQLLPDGRQLRTSRIRWSR